MSGVLTGLCLYMSLDSHMKLAEKILINLVISAHLQVFIGTEVFLWFPKQVSSAGAGYHGISAAGFSNPFLSKWQMPCMF